MPAFPSFRVTPPNPPIVTAPEAAATQGSEIDPTDVPQDAVPPKRPRFSVRGQSRQPGRKTCYIVLAVLIPLFIFGLILFGIVQGLNHKHATHPRRFRVARNVSTECQLFCAGRLVDFHGCTGRDLTCVCDALEEFRTFHHCHFTSSCDTNGLDKEGVEHAVDFVQDLSDFCRANPRRQSAASIASKSVPPHLERSLSLVDRLHYHNEKSSTQQGILRRGGNTAANAIVDVVRTNSGFRTVRVPVTQTTTTTTTTERELA